MRIWKLSTPILFLFAVSLACNLWPGSSTPTPTAAGPAYWTPGAGTCQIVATGPVDIRNRPSPASQIFSHMAAGDREDVTAFAAGGWAGFNPAIAQAPNIPLFQNRWVQLGSNAHLEGACASIPVVVGPPPGICFAMIWDTEPVYASADTSSAVLATLHKFDYVALLQDTGTWAQVDLSSGNVGLPVQGWIQTFDINQDGVCSALSTPTSTATAAAYHPVFTPGAGECDIVATGPATIYNRPSLSSDVFSSFAAGDRYAAMAYTADAFVGFDPAYAQAGNVGLFRYRWAQLGPNVHLEGNCGSLPLVVGPPPGVCFAMAYQNLSVYISPSTNSTVVGSMQPADYAEIIERTADWLKVDLSIGNLGSQLKGWIQESMAGLNGPCDSIPTSTAAPKAKLPHTPTVPPPTATPTKKPIQLVPINPKKILPFITPTKTIEPPR